MLFCVAQVAILDVLLGIALIVLLDVLHSLHPWMCSLDMLLDVSIVALSEVSWWGSGAVSVLSWT